MTIERLFQVFFEDVVEFSASLFDSQANFASAGFPIMRECEVNTRPALSDTDTRTQEAPEFPAHDRSVPSDAFLLHLRLDVFAHAVPRLDYPINSYGPPLVRRHVSLSSNLRLFVNTTMTSRIMMRSVSAPAATDLTTPPVVASTLNETAFKPSTTRRDLSTSYRAVKQAWFAIEQVQVSSAACRRVGERAAEVLTAVREQLLQVEQRELERQRGKVVLERSYEFQQQGQGSTGGSEATIFKIQA